MVRRASTTAGRSIRIAIRERPAQRAAVAHLRVADLVGGVREQRHLRRAEHADVSSSVIDAPTRGFAIVVRRVLDVRQVRNTRRRRAPQGGREPQLHQGEERVTTGEQLGVVAVLDEQRRPLPPPTTHARSRMPAGITAADSATSGCRRSPPAPRALPSRCWWYPVQRQRLPSSPSRTRRSSSSGFLGRAARRPPSPCRACSNRTAERGSRGMPPAPGAGCREGSASPSMVMMSAPSACAARTVHDFTDWPSSSTVPRRTSWCRSRCSSP